MEIDLIMTALLVSFGLTVEALSKNPMGTKTVASAANEGVENLRNLFDSITKDDGEKTDTYRQILQEESEREQRAFDRMKEELRPARQRNIEALMREDFRNIARKLAIKRETGLYDNIIKAIQAEHLPFVEQLVNEDGKRVMETTPDKKSTAFLAAELGHLHILQYLLEKNATLLTVTDIYGNTPLQRAIQNGHIATVKYLVEERGLSILQIDHHINTAVHVAAQAGQYYILQYFVEEKKADVNIRNLNGETPLFVAAEKPHMRVIKYLLEERHADPTALDVMQDNILYKSARANDLKVPMYLLDTKKVQFDVNWKNTLGYTVVNWASRFKSTEFVKYMVEQKKADINHPDTKMCRTPLHQAALTNNSVLCEFLVWHGAKVDAKDKLGNTPAALTTDADVLECLSPASNRKRRSLAEASSNNSRYRAH